MRDPGELVTVRAGGELLCVGLNELFTDTVTQALQVFAECTRGHGAWVHRNVYTAAHVLRSGPWTYLGGEIRQDSPSFQLECRVLTQLMDWMEHVTVEAPRRQVLAEARYWLEPNPDPTCMPRPRLRT